MRLREMQHRCDNNRGKRRLWHVSEKGGQEEEREETKNCRDEISELAASVRGNSHRGRRHVLQPGFETSGWAYSGSQL